LARRSDLGSNWSDVVANWCLGVKPPIPDNTAWEALAIIERFWPERLDSIVTENGRGIAVIAPIIDLGIILTDCENLQGFADVFVRLKQNEGAAFSELFVASTLVRLGYKPTLEPSLNGKKLDAVISADSEEIYFEVISPIASQAIQQVIKEATEFVNQLLEQFPGTSTDIILFDMFSGEIKRKLVEFIKTMRPSYNENFEELNHVAIIRHMLFRPEGTPFNPSNRKGPKLGIAAANSNARVNLVQPVLSDERLQRLMDDEAKHFSHEKINILMIDVSGIPQNFKAWRPLIKRRFQPGINRRFSAVILFQRKLITKGIIRTHWNILNNQYAYKDPTHALENTFKKLTDQND
jgi:hypothetical protein